MFLIIVLFYVLDFKPICFEKELDSSNISKNESLSESHLKKYFSDCITEEECNNLYKKVLLNDDIKNKNEYFSKNIQDILKEMYVDSTFVTACQHMIELCGKYFFIVYDSQ